MLSNIGRAAPEISPVHTPNTLSSAMHPDAKSLRKPLAAVASSSDIRSVISTLSYSKSGNPTPNATSTFPPTSNPEDSDSPLAADKIPMFSPNSTHGPIPEVSASEEKSEPASSERAELNQTATSLVTEEYDNDFQSIQY